MEMQSLEMRIDAFLNELWKAGLLEAREVNGELGYRIPQGMSADEWQERIDDFDAVKPWVREALEADEDS